MSQKNGIFALILLSAIYASMGIFARALSVSFPLFTQVFVRIFAAFIISSILFVPKFHWKKFSKVSRKEWMLLSARGFAFYAIGVPLFTLSILETKYGNVSFIYGLPISAFLAWIFLREKMTKEKLFYILLAFFGAIMISVKDYSHLGEWGSGEVLAFISSLVFAFTYISRRWHSKILSDAEITVGMLGVGVISLFGLMFFFSEPVPIAGWSIQLFVIVVVAGVFNAVGLFLTNFGFSRVKAILASNILTLETVFGVLIGILLYGEIPAMKELVGGVLILLSVLRMNRLK